jgi:hypothetical protein
MCLIFVDLTRCVMILQMTPNVPSFKSHYDDDDLEDLLCVENTRLRTFDCHVVSGDYNG